MRKTVEIHVSIDSPRWIALFVAGLLTWACLGSAGSPVSAGANALQGMSNTQPEVTCPSGQCFQDVEPGSTYYDYANNLYLDNIVSGYACGGVGEPCIAPDNRPYYRPTADVSRGQMSKFADLGRRNIADAVGINLTLGSASNTTLIVANHGTSNPGYGGYFTTDSNVSTAVSAVANHGIGIQATSNDSSGWSLYVNAAGGNHTTNSTYIAGKLHLVDGCTGCAGPDVILQNLGSDTLQPGALVSIIGSTQLDGQTIVQVRSTQGAKDTTVAGVVGGAVYVPDAKLVAQYKAQKAAYDDAVNKLNAAMAAGDKAGAAAISVPQMTIRDKDAMVHDLAGVTSIQSGAYAWLVNSSTALVQVDATSAPVHAADLLTTSLHAGYAVKAQNPDAATGAIIGKALSDLSSGNGTIQVLLTLK